jgi:hypothetical protein
MSIAEFPSSDPIWKFSNPKTAQRLALVHFGPATKLYRSKTKTKKYAVIRPDGRIVNFGAMGYEDFTRHKSKKRRQNYLTRSAKIKGSWRKDKYSANNLARKLLW